MDDFSIPTDAQVYVDVTQEKEWNSFHALKGIQGRRENSYNLYQKYRLNFFARNFHRLDSLVSRATGHISETWKDPGSNPGSDKHFFHYFYILFFYLEMLLLYVKMINSYNTTILTYKRSISKQKNNKNNEKSVLFSQIFY